jgi:hypothetical protein
MQTTKMYENTTDKPMNVIGVGVIEAHDRISVTTEFHAPVNLANYPGLVDVLAEEEANGPAKAPASPAPAQPAAPAQQTNSESEAKS